MVIATAGVPSEEQGVVGGVINTSRQVGAAMGAATLPAIAAAVGHNPIAATASGSRAAMLAGAAAAGLATLIAWRSGRASRSAEREVTRAPIPAAVAAPQLALRGNEVSSSAIGRREVHHARPYRPAGLPDRIRSPAASSPVGNLTKPAWRAQNWRGAERKRKGVAPGYGRGH
jgi:hypothetical protein